MDGQRAALMTVQKTGNASTLDIITQHQGALPRIAASLPPELRDQAARRPVAVRPRRRSTGVIREAVIAACLTALMILLFLGSWRSTLIIAISIPLSILRSIIMLSALGETINIMTLGGLALAVGILVDDATVAIENINTHLEQGKDARTGDSRRRPADCGARRLSRRLHLHRLRPDVLPHRRRALSVRAAGRSGRVRDAGVVRAVAHAGADDGEYLLKAHQPEAHDADGRPPAMCLPGYSGPSTKGF